MNSESSNEVWMAIPGFEGKYSVSNLGRVLNHRFSRLLKGKFDKQGYHSFELTVSREKSLFHRGAPLVLLAFRGPRPSPAHQAAHLDGDRKNNVLDNLEWKTPKANIADRERHGNTVKGEKHWDCKLTPTQVFEIRDALAAREPLRSIARRYGIGKTTVTHIKTGRSWGHLKSETMDVTP